MLGGVLALFDWRYIFLVSVPVGAIGTVWSYLKLKEIATIRKNQKLDVWGNVTFAVGLTLVLVGVTYALIPYGSSSMGWGDPWVLASLVGRVRPARGLPVRREQGARPDVPPRPLQEPDVRRRQSSPDFLASMGRGGVQIMLIILLQGIWLPLHGVSYESTPFWAGVYMIPMLLGFVVMGPLSGHLSDKYGARLLSTLGMVITASRLPRALAPALRLQLPPVRRDHLRPWASEAGCSRPRTRPRS